MILNVLKSNPKKKKKSYRTITLKLKKMIKQKAIKRKKKW